MYPQYTNLHRTILSNRNCLIYLEVNQKKRKLQKPISRKFLVHMYGEYSPNNVYCLIIRKIIKLCKCIFETAIQRTFHIYNRWFEDICFRKNNKTLYNRKELAVFGVTLSKTSFTVLPSSPIRK